MARPYSQDLRERVLRAYDRGMKTKQIAVTFHVSSAWARRVKQRRRETGETTHRPMGGPGVTIVDRERLAALVGTHPDATLAELRGLLGVQCALSTLCKALKQIGLSFKKNDPCGGTGPPGYRATAGAVAFLVARHGCQTIDLHR
jgi:transposase